MPGNISSLIRTSPPTLRPRSRVDRRIRWSIYPASPRDVIAGIELVVISLAFGSL
jgi:hypothetical protein